MRLLNYSIRQKLFVSEAGVEEYIHGSNLEVFSEMPNVWSKVTPQGRCMHGCPDLIKSEIANSFLPLMDSKSLLLYWNYIWNHDSLWFSLQAG